MEPEIRTSSVDSPAGKRFSISNSTSYYSGNADMSPGGFGQHIPMGMNGLWHPPVRLLGSLRFSDRQEQRVTRFETLPDRRIFHIVNGRIEMAMPEGHLLLLHTRLSRGESLHLSMDVGPVSVWQSVWEPEWTMEYREGRVLLDFMKPPMAFAVIPYGARLVLSEQTIHAKMTDGCSVLFTILNQGSPASDGLPNIVPSPLQAQVMSTARIECDDTAAEEAYYWSKLGLSWLAHRQEGIGYGITAGHPEFPWYFGLDTFHCLDALLETGQWECAKGTLEILTSRARRQQGRIPHEIITNGRIYNQGDIEESAMFPSALKKYYDWSGDRIFTIGHLQDALNALLYVSGKDFAGPGAMEDEERGSAKEIDTMCYFVEGTEALSSLLRAIEAEGGADGVELGQLPSLAGSTREFVRREMWLPELSTFANRVIDGVPVFKGHWTSITPFVTGIAAPEQYREFVSSEEGGLSLHSTGNGITVEQKKKTVMPVLNGLMSFGASRYDDAETMQRFHECNMSRFGQFMPCALPEISDNADGCYLQAWSSAILVHVLLGCYLGIRVEGGSLSCSPLLRRGGLSSIKLRGLRIRDSFYTVSARIDDRGECISTISVET